MSSLDDEEINRPRRDKTILKQRGSMCLDLWVRIPGATPSPPQNVCLNMIIIIMIVSMAIIRVLTMCHLFVVFTMIDPLTII